MKYSLSFLTAVLLFTTPAFSQVTLAKWTFESLTVSSTYTNGGGAITNIPADTGSGTASGLHATTASSQYTTPVGDGSTKSLSANNWSVGDSYEFAVSTVGYSGISISWAQASSGTGPGSFNIEYSTDNVNFTIASAYTFTSSGSFSGSSTCGTCTHTFSFSSIPALNNAAVVYFRLTDNSTTSASGGTVGTGGTSRIDDFTVSGNAIGALAITSQPQSRTNNAGTVATFAATVTGNNPTFKWQKDNVDLSDGGKILGSSTPTLTVSNVLSVDVGGYRLVVTDNSGSGPVSNSIVANLTVIDPVFTTQPVSHTNVAGDNGNFFITAAGTPFFLYQWRHEGTNVPGATATALNLPNVQTTDQGNYVCVATNGNNIVITSSLATLTLLATPSTRIAEWDFNLTNTYPATAPVPSVGTGTASLVGGTTAAFAPGTFSDNAALPGLNNSGWNTTSYPAQGTANKTAGTQFKVSTAGYRNILLTWEERHSNTASKYTRLQYSTDGINFVDGPSIVMSNTNNDFVFCSANLSGISALNDNANFAFQMVAEYESTAINNTNTNYTGTVTAYGTAGTIRYDLVNVFGDTAGPSLSSQVINGKLVVSWSDNTFALQAATNVTGLYTNILGLTGTSYTNNLNASRLFLRLYKQIP